MRDTTVLAPPVRAADWENLVVPEGYQAQVIQGELVVTPAPSVNHGRALMRLAARLAAAAPNEYEPVSGPEWRLEIAASSRWPRSPTSW